MWMTNQGGFLLTPNVGWNMRVILRESSWLRDKMRPKQIVFVDRISVHARAGCCSKAHLREMCSLQQ